MVLIFVILISSEDTNIERTKAQYVVVSNLLTCPD
jgi:hypothetical protein